MKHTYSGPPPPPSSDVVPEPTTITIIGIGLVGLAGTEVRSKRKKEAIDKN